MRTLFLPLGLAVLFFNPSFVQAIDTERASESPTPLSLNTALDLAFHANPALSAARHELEALGATVIQAQVLPNPEISSTIEDTRRATRTTTLLLSQPIELGGKRADRVKAATWGQTAALAELDARRAEIRASVVIAFFDVLVAQERMRLAQSSIELAQRVSSAAARRVVAGKVAPLEEIRARVAEAGVRVEFTLATSELTSARKRLASTWGNPTPRFERAEGELETLPVLPALDDLHARLNDAPQLRRARIEVDRRLALVNVERSRRIPNLTVSLGARRDEELSLNQAIFGISMPVPVFNRNQGNLLESLSRTDKSRDELSATEIRLSNDLAIAYEQLMTARSETETLLREILPGAQSGYDAATRGFELGKFGFMDVLDAQRTLFQAQSQYLRALALTHRSAAEINRILGDVAPDSPLTSAVNLP